MLSRDHTEESRDHLPADQAHHTAPRQVGTEAASDLIEQIAGDQGFALVGVAAAEPSAHAAYIHRWLQEGKHGEMDYLAKHVEMRIDPKRLLPGVQSIICVADRHPVARLDEEPAEKSPPLGRIARYAWGDDYHKVIKKRLWRLADALRRCWPKYQYRTVVDTAPILEREHAVRAGLGWIGKHTLLIHSELGSWFLLGQILTTLPVVHVDRRSADHCGTCTRCIDACPTKCIEPYHLNASRCISYLTIEHRGPISPEFHDQMGNWIAGCDVCQEVCPFNREQPKESESSSSIYAVRPPGPAISLLDILNWDAPARQIALRRSALKRIRLGMFKRNALIASGNYLKLHADSALRRRIQTIASDATEAELVRSTASQVLRSLEDVKSGH